MFIVYFLALIGYVTLWFAPVVYIWCVKPGKSLQEGLRDWIDEE